MPDPTKKISMEVGFFSVSSYCMFSFCWGNVFIPLLRVELNLFLVWLRVVVGAQKDGYF